MAVKDYGLIRSRAKLSAICKRATTPEEWAKFATASKVTKIMRTNSLNNCSLFLQRIFLVEQRRCGFGKFFDGSKPTKWHQALQNRLVCMAGLGMEWRRDQNSDEEIIFFTIWKFIHFYQWWLIFLYHICDNWTVNFNFELLWSFSPRRERIISWNKSCQSINVKNSLTDIVKWYKIRLKIPYLRVIWTVFDPSPTYTKLKKRVDHLSTQDYFT